MLKKDLPDDNDEEEENEPCSAIGFQYVPPEEEEENEGLFNYYLPTMERVVDRYLKIESSGVDNPEIPGNLRQYFDDITLAMQSEYEGLFDNDKLNVTVDMEAMTIALKRDGLLDEEDFKDLTPDESLDIRS